jgi:hypothetical protein
MMFPGNPFHCEKTMPVHRRGNHDSGMIAGKKNSFRQLLHLAHQTTITLL